MVFFSTLVLANQQKLGTFSKFEQSLISQCNSKGYAVQIACKKPKEINGEKFLFTSYVAISTEIGHRRVFMQIYVPYSEHLSSKYTYQVLGDPNTLRVRALAYIYSKVKAIVHMPAFNFVDAVEEGKPVYIQFGDESHVYNSKTQARKLFPGAGVKYVNSSLCNREKKALLGNLISRNITYTDYREISAENIKMKIIDFLADMKFDNLLSDHEIFENFCLHYEPYTSYILYKFL